MANPNKKWEEVLKKESYTIEGNGKVINDNDATRVGNIAWIEGAIWALTTTAESLRSTGLTDSAETVERTIVQFKSILSLS